MGPGRGQLGWAGQGLPECALWPCSSPIFSQGLCARQGEAAPIPAQGMPQRVAGCVRLGRAMRPPWRGRAKETHIA